MSAQTFPTVPIDPNDPHLTQEVDEGYRRRRSQRIFELDANLATKAKEHDDCGRMSESLGCNRHDTVRILEEDIRTCKQRWSLCCGPRIAAKRMRDHERIIETIATMSPPCDYPERIALITITMPMPRDRAAIEDFKQRMWKITNKLCRDAAHRSDDDFNLGYYAKPCIKGFDGGRLVVQIPYWGPYISPEKFRGAYAKLGDGVDTQVLIRPNSHAAEVFREAFGFLVPQDPIEQAELEVLFTGMDLMTTYEFGLTDLGLHGWDDDLVPTTKEEAHGTPVEGTKTPHSIENCDECEIRMLPTCPDCGEQANVRSGLHRAHALPAEVHLAGWRPMFG